MQMKNVMKLQITPKKNAVMIKLLHKACHE